MSRRTLALLVLLAALAIVYFLSRSGLHQSARPAGESVAGTQPKLAFPRTTDGDNPAGRLLRPLDAKTLGTEKRETANYGVVHVQPDLTGTPSMQRILAESAPGARGMFQSGLQSLEQGDFNAARRTFHEILADYGWDCAQNKLAGPAYWAVALCYYREGGEDGLALACTFFQNFLQTYPDCEPRELAPAAQIDLAVTYLDRMRLAEKEPARERAARGAVTALKTFLEKFPDSPQAYSAGLALAEMQDCPSCPR
jgi:hypothetical protein